MKRLKFRLKWLYFRLRYRVWYDPRISRKNADSLFLVMACILSGLVQLASQAFAPSVEDQLGFIPTVFWASCLLAGGSISMTGIWWKNSDTGIIIESAGRYVLCSASGIYAILVFVQNGTRSTLPAFFTLLFGLACLTRAIHITFWVQQRKTIHGYSAE